MSSKIEYLNAEEVAIRSIAFSGKISQKSSAFFVLMIAKYWIQRHSVSKIVVRHRLKHCTMKTVCRIKFGSLQ